MNKIKMTVLEYARQFDSAVATAYYFIHPDRTAMTGYHATTKEAAYEIVNKGIWIPSTGNGEWFGHGVYFWPSIEAAEIWIQKKCARSGAIIQATIVTGFCIDLDNYSKFGELFYEAHLHKKKFTQ